MPKNRHKDAPKRPAKKHAKPAPKAATHTADTTSNGPAHDAPARPMSPAAFAIGLLAILVAILASGMLALDKFEMLKLPGCGEGSGCGAAAASKFGNFPIPGLDITWPLAFIGLAYFIAIGVAWLANRKGVSTALRFILICGGIGSLFYVTIMIAKPDYICPYCLATHIANFVLIGVALIAGGFSLASSSTLAVTATAFIVASCALFVGDRVSDTLARNKGEAQLAESIDELTKRTQQAKADAAEGKPDAPAKIVDRPDTPTDPDAWKDDPRLTWTGREGFTGNYLWGEEDAPIRLVVFSDYQCEDCGRVHEEIKKLLADHPDVSFSHKHFPFAPPCNPAISADSRVKHDNACWASRAAETAGILYGPEGFRSFHDWLFDVHGGFTDAEIVAELKRRNWDVDKFLEIMQSPRTLEIVQKDCLEGSDLGLYYTPMMFVNGVQVRGFRVRNILTRAVEALAQQSPPPGLATDDWPAAKCEKYVDDYFSDVLSPRYGRIGADPFIASEGPEDAPIQIQAYVSYRSDYAKRLQDAIDECIAKHPGMIRVIYRHFPASNACNENIIASVDDGEITCTMAKAVEAAGQIAGPEAFVTLHRWTLDHQDNWSLDDFAVEAAAVGVDPAQLRSKMESPEVDQALQADIKWLKTARLGGKAAIFINNKHVYNWSKDDCPIIEGIVDKLAEQSN